MWLSEPSESQGHRSWRGFMVQGCEGLVTTQTNKQTQGHSFTQKERNQNTRIRLRHLTYTGNPFFSLLWYKIWQLDHKGLCPNQWFSPRLQQNYQGVFKNHQCLGPTQAKLESLQ